MIKIFAITISDGPSLTTKYFSLKFVPTLLFIKVFLFGWWCFHDGMSCRVSVKWTLNLVDQDFLDYSCKTYFHLSGNMFVLSQNSLTMEQSGKENSKFYMVEYRKGYKGKIKIFFPASGWKIQRSVRFADTLLETQDWNLELHF